MPRVIDYWRGLVTDIREAQSNSPEHLREVGDLWYPVLRMRILTAVHDGAERKLGPVDLPAAHAEQVARRVWNDLVAAMHKRAVPEAWTDYAAIITRLRPWLAGALKVSESDVRNAVAALTTAEVETLSAEAFPVLYPNSLPSREEQVVRGAINAFLLQDRPWPDLGTWVPFTLYSLTARYFETGHYLGAKLCSSESEILDLVEIAPYGRDWALNVVRRRAQARTVESYSQILSAILDRSELPQTSSLVARRLTLVEWLSDPEARLSRLVEVQGLAVSEGAVRRGIRGEDRDRMLAVLMAAVGKGAYPEALNEEQRRAALERLVETLEACPLRTEMLVHVAHSGGKRGAAWAKSVVTARAGRSERSRQLALLQAITSRKEIRLPLGPSQRNRSLRALYRTLSVAAQPGAGVKLEVAHAAQGAG